MKKIIKESNDIITKRLNFFNKRALIIILLLLIVVVSGTFAWFTYSSRQSALVLTIGDIEVNNSEMVLSPYQIRETMMPVNDYTGGVYSQVKVTNNNNLLIPITFFYRVNDLSQELIEGGLKYTIVMSDSEEGTYTEVLTGDFSDYKSGDAEIIILNKRVEPNTIIYYRVYLWLDSNFGNQSDIQGYSLDLELNGALNYIPKMPSYAVYSADDKSLRFYKTNEKITQGSTYNGLKVTAVYSDIETSVYNTATSQPWYNKDITKVVVEDPITPISGKYLFSNLWKCLNINVTNLDPYYITDMSYMFYRAGYNAALFDIVGLDLWDMSLVVDISYMFQQVGYQSKVVTISDISGWDTSSVVSMAFSFDRIGFDATSLDISDISEWNTSKVTTMYCMFQGLAYNATDFSFGDLSTKTITREDGTTYIAWDTSNVTTMKNMFNQALRYGIIENITLDLSKWNTSKVTDMSYMFNGFAYNTKTFILGDLSTKTITREDGTTYIAWDTSNVVNMASMFSTAAAEATTWYIGDLSKWNTSKVTNMSYMFNYVGQHASTINIGDVNTKVVTLSDDISYVAWDVANVTTMTCMFQRFGYYDASTIELDVSYWNTSKVTDMNWAFNLIGSISATTWSIGDLSEKSVDLKDNSGNIVMSYTAWDVSNVTSMQAMFFETGKMASTWTVGNLGTWDVSNVTNMHLMFSGTGWYTSSWTVGDLSDWDTSNVTTMYGMFTSTGNYASSWTVGDLSKWNTSKVESMYIMFQSAGYSASEFNVGDLSTKIVTREDGTTYIAWDVSKVETMQAMFASAGDYSETWFIGDIGNWDTSSVINVVGMFRSAGRAASNWNNNKELSLSTKTVNLTDDSGNVVKSYTAWNVSNVTDYDNFAYLNFDRIIQPNWPL